MMTPASSTPPMTARTLDLKSKSSRLAARVPVQAPVPGRGIPTKRSRATKRPRPALACSFWPPRSPLRKNQANSLPITGLVEPHSNTLRAKR